MLDLHLAQPPEIVNVGVGVHGVRGPHDVFRLPDLWQFHVYGYHGELTLLGETHRIRPGAVSFVPPGVQVRFDYRGRSEHLFAHFRTVPVGRPARVPVLQDAGAAAGLLGDLMRHAVAAFPGGSALVTAEVWAVLWRVAQLAEHPDAADGRGPGAVAIAAAHVEANLALPLAVPDLARVAGVSHNHLIRLFRAETGLTVVAYVRSRRMARARHLLTSSTLSIPAVAATVGITDLQAFNKLCRRELGGSPRAVRARSG
ncbi:helix-turn-helix domain-containing protein [Pseudonocardia sp. GCM10023141]|uniref:helix-turn-helix domain-containing protein n=1 Tax=Pseudonocardia sp. GCM10023141 TaxID=3252653 RepID=UPI003620DA1C